MKRLTLITLAAVLGLLSGCAQYDNKRGVLQEVQATDFASFTPGETSRQDVLAKLGPPSQVIALGDETVFYYLFEKSRGNGLILVVYNRFSVETNYDRAIFFFDEQDRLTDFSTQVGGGAG